MSPPPPPPSHHPGQPAGVQAHPPPATRDWRDMTRHDFDAAAGPPALFDLEPSAVTADDGVGTGDLLELLEPHA